MVSSIKSPSAVYSPRASELSWISRINLRRTVSPANVQHPSVGSARHRRSAGAQLVLPAESCLLIDESYAAPWADRIEQVRVAPTPGFPSLAPHFPQRLRRLFFRETCRVQVSKLLVVHEREKFFDSGI